MNIAYIRVSTDEQATNGYGLEAQLDAIRRHIGGEPDAVYRDDITGKRADRPGLLAALDALKKGDVLIVSKRDRLARDVMLSCWIEKEVKKKGATIVSAAGEGTDGDVDDSTQILLRRIIDAFAEFERLRIGERTKAALAVRRKKGLRNGGKIPYGYRDESGKLVEDADEQTVIFHIIKLRDSGRSIRSIISEINATGFKPRDGGRWSPASVHAILNRKEI